MEMTEDRIEAGKAAWRHLVGSITPYQFVKEAQGLWSMGKNDVTLERAVMFFSKAQEEMEGHEPLSAGDQEILVEYAEWWCEKYYLLPSLQAQYRGIVAAAAAADIPMKMVLEATGSRNVVVWDNVEVWFQPDDVEVFMFQELVDYHKSDLEGLNEEETEAVLVAVDNVVEDDDFPWDLANGPFPEAEREMKLSDAKANRNGGDRVENDPFEDAGPEDMDPCPRPRGR